MAAKKIKKTKKVMVKKDNKKVKSGKNRGNITDMGASALSEEKTLENKSQALEGKLQNDAQDQATKEASSSKKIHHHGKRYLAAKKQVDPKKLYSLDEALKLLAEVSISHFNGSVEMHLVVSETGLHGEVEFPHATGKILKIAIADEDTLKKIENNKIDFNVLLATPAQMPKLVKFARILGPKGLMPNPKSGTVTADPEKTIKSMSGKTKFKTETKAPLIHIVIGKTKDESKAIKENFLALIAAVEAKNILKISLTPTMGPSIKLDLSQLA